LLGAVPHIVNANTASSLFDALVQCTSVHVSIDEGRSGDGNDGSVPPSLVAGAVNALDALLSIPNSPLCSSTTVQKRISISLVPSVLPLLRSTHDIVKMVALECVESVLRHWVHAFNSPEGLYMLVPETMVLAHSPRDQIRFRARPILGTHTYTHTYTHTHTHTHTHTLSLSHTYTYTYTLSSIPPTPGTQLRWLAICESHWLKNPLL